MIGPLFCMTINRTLLDVKRKLEEDLDDLRKRYKESSKLPRKAKKKLRKKLKADFEFKAMLLSWNKDFFNIY